MSEFLECDYPDCDSTDHVCIGCDGYGYVLDDNYAIVQVQCRMCRGAGVWKCPV